MEYEQLKRKADVIKSLLTDIAKSTDLSWNEKLRNQMTILVNRALEADSRAFVVIVVGPVKSGKSTLVNLLAHSMVSPTNYLECTVRPSIISRKKENEDCWITTYVRREREDVSDVDVDYVDMVIDSIKGLSTAYTDGIETRKYELNEVNLKNQVELSLDRSMEIGKETLLTSITADGGPFLGPDIYLVDMPGFDGAKANLDDPFYRTITHRADLVIFIQSSNSAISKISDEFFQILKDGNQHVPVCLVHNYFESAYWRNPKKQQEKLDEQKDSAIKAIRSHGFNLFDQNCISINLGKVEDFSVMDDGRIVRSEFKGDLMKEADRFQQMEKDLYQHVSSSQHTTRLANCIGRVEHERLRLLDMISVQKERFERLREKYREAETAFSQLADDADLQCADEDFVLDVNEADICLRIERMAASFKATRIDPKMKCSGQLARQMVGQLLAEIADEIKRLLGKAMDFGNSMRKVQNMTDARHNGIKAAVIDLSPETARQMRPLTDFGMEESPLETDTTVIQKTYDTRVRIPDTYYFNRYSADAVKAFVNIAVVCVIGDVLPSQPDSRVGGVLQTRIVPEAAACYHERMKRIVENRREKYLEYLNGLKKALLESIIGDLADFEAKENILRTLENRIRGLNFDSSQIGLI